MSTDCVFRGMLAAMIIQHIAKETDRPVMLVAVPRQSLGVSGRTQRCMRAVYVEANRSLSSTCPALGWYILLRSYIVYTAVVQSALSPRARRRLLRAAQLGPWTLHSGSGHSRPHDMLSQRWKLQTRRNFGIFPNQVRITIVGNLARSNLLFSCSVFCVLLLSQRRSV